MDYLHTHHALLDLGELENDRNEARDVPFGLQGALVAELQAVEGNVDEIFIKQKVLTLFVGKDDHKGLDE